MSIVSGVYKITLVADGRIYIGSSADIHGRWVEHTTRQEQVIGKAIEKYGKDAFEFEIIEICSPTKEILQEREQFYLDQLQPFPWINNQGFNIAPNAYTPLGIRRSDETKKKMSEVWHKNRDEAYYLQLSENMKGDKNPAKRPEVRAKISNSRKGQTWKHDTERMEKHRAARTGRKRSEQAKANMSEAQRKNNTRSEVAKEKFYLAQRKLYEIMRPDSSVFQMYSRELKSFCSENGLSYANLITTAKTNRPYKGGWLAKLV